MDASVRLNVARGTNSASILAAGPRLCCSEASLGSQSGHSSRERLESQIVACTHTPLSAIFSAIYVVLLPVTAEVRPMAPMFRLAWPFDGFLTVSMLFHVCHILKISLVFYAKSMASHGRLALVKVRPPAQRLSQKALKTRDFSCHSSREEQ